MRWEVPLLKLWRRNFCERRVEGLRKAPGSGRPRKIDDDRITRVQDKTLERHNPCISTPTHASWLNLVGISFSILAKQQARRGVSHDVPELIATIEHFTRASMNGTNRSSGPRPPSGS